MQVKKSFTTHLQYRCKTLGSRRYNKDQNKTTYFYRPQRSCGKVMFSQASVILFRGVYPSIHWGRHPPRHTPPGQTPPPPRWPMQRTVRIYWNAFLWFLKIKGCSFPNNFIYINYSNEIQVVSQKLKWGLKYLHYFMNLNGSFYVRKFSLDWMPFLFLPQEMYWLISVRPYTGAFRFFSLHKKGWHLQYNLSIVEIVLSFF